VEHFFRHEFGRLVAVLTRSLGVRRLDLVEDVVQAALVQALETWSRRGVPEDPAGWLYRTARNLAIDALQRERTHAQALPRLAEDAERESSPPRRLPARCRRARHRVTPAEGKRHRRMRERTGARGVRPAGRHHPAHFLPGGLFPPLHWSERSGPRPYQTAAKPARSSATLCLAPLLIAVGRETRDHGGKLPEHLRPTELGTPKRLIAPRLGDVEA
jgi:hypothetical protein